MRSIRFSLEPLFHDEFGSGLNILNMELRKAIDAVEIVVFETMVTVASAFLAGAYESMNDEKSLFASE